MVVTQDGSAWLIELRATEQERGLWSREPSLLLRSDGGPWETVRPLADDLPAEPVALSLDPRGRLVVHLRETGGVTNDLRYPTAPGSYGDREWLARLGSGGEWDIASSEEGLVPTGMRLFSSTERAVWMSPECSQRGGVTEVREDRLRVFLDGTCVLDAVAGTDGRVWVTATDHATMTEGVVPDIYIITPTS